MAELSSRDLAVLQGAWEQVELEVDGILNPPDEHSAPGATTTFSKNHFSVRTAEGAILLEGTFELDAAATPKAVDWIDAIGAEAGKKLPAIYKLDGNDFTFIAGDENAPRPTNFCTGPGQTKRTFVRRR